MASAGKGSKVDLLTFKEWGKDGVIGYKTVNIDHREFVNFVWCKVCARNKDALLQHPNELRLSTVQSKFIFRKKSGEVDRAILNQQRSKKWTMILHLQVIVKMRHRVPATKSFLTKALRNHESDSTVAEFLSDEDSISLVNDSD